MRALVTGAAGLTGAAVVADLLESGMEVIALVHNEAQRHTVATGAEIAVGDCADAATVGPLLRRCDHLVHVAGIRLAGALASLPYLRDVDTIVAISTAAVHSRKHRGASEYRANEQALRAAHPNTLIVRPTMIYGSGRDRNVHHVIAFAWRFGFLPVVGAGTALIQPIHYRDLAFAVSRLVGRPPLHPIDAGGAGSINMREAATTILTALGRPPRLIGVPYVLARRAAATIDPIRGSRWVERVDRMLEDRTVDIHDLVELTGVRPRSFEAGVRDEVEELGLRKQRHT